MSSIWTAGLGLMFNTAGKNCITEIEGTITQFRGILDRVQVEEEDETGRYVRNDSALRVRKEIANFFYNKSMIPVTVEGKDYIITECKYLDDGEEAICLIVPVEEEDAC